MVILPKIEMMYLLEPELMFNINLHFYTKKTFITCAIWCWRRIKLKLQFVYLSLSFDGSLYQKGNKSTLCLMKMNVLECLTNNS